MRHVRPNPLQSVISNQHQAAAGASVGAAARKRAAHPMGPRGAAARTTPDALGKKIYAVEVSERPAAWAMPLRVPGPRSAV
jgi:hypothetical protein